MVLVITYAVGAHAVIIKEDVYVWFLIAHSKVYI